MISHYQLTDNYPIKKLGEIATFLDNLRKPVTASDRIEGDYPYYGANGQQGTINDYIFDEPLVLLAEDGGNFDDPTRPIAYTVEGKTWVNNHAHVLRPNTGTNIRYLFWVLAFYNVMPFVKGATRAKLNKTDASRIPIPLPPLETQKRIVALLDKAQELIDKRKEQIALMDQLIQSLFYDMFGDPVKNPKGWNQGLLGEVASFENGDRSSKYPKSEDIISEGILFFGTQNIGQNGEFNNSELKFISQRKLDSLSQGKLRKGDIVISLRGSIGNCCVFDSEAYNKGFINAQLMIIRCQKGMMNQFLIKCLMSKSVNRLLLRIGSGSAVPQLTASQLKKLKIPVPPINTQRNFVERVQKIEAQKEAMTSSLKELEDNFNSLMQRAFKGEL